MGAKKFIALITGLTICSVFIGWSLLNPIYPALFENVESGAQQVENLSGFQLNWTEVVSAHPILYQTPRFV